MTKPIVVVGSVNLDLVVGADRTSRVGETVAGKTFNTYYGGKGANQAVAAAKLGYPVAMVGCVGDDPFGEQLRKGLNDAGVDTVGVRTVEGSSGVALITTGASGENNIVVVPGANGHLKPAVVEEMAPLLESAGMLLVQLEVPLDTVEYVAQLASRKSIPLMLDPAPALDLPSDLLSRVLWITPNEIEIQELLKMCSIRGKTVRAVSTSTRWRSSRSISTHTQSPMRSSKSLSTLLTTNPKTA